MDNERPEITLIPRAPGQEYQPIEWLRTEADHATALAEIRRLWNSPVGTPDGDQLDLLLVLVDAYEAEHWRTAH